MMKKTLFTQIASMILALFMIVSVLVVVPFSASAETVATPDWLTANFDGVKTYTIDDAADLLAFKAALATKDFAGETVKLTADIDMSGISSWTIATDTFSGTLDGQKHSIKNLNTTTGVQFGGVLFGTLNGATVQDLSLIDGVNSGLGNYGALIAGQTSGKNTICNLYVNNAISSGAVNLGGLIGLGSATITFENCVVASTVDNSAYTGRSGAISGFIGRIKGATKIEYSNCAFIGSVVAGSQSWAGAFCGVNEHTQFTSSVNYDIVVAENAASMGTITAVLSSQSADEADDVTYVTPETFDDTLLALSAADWIRTGETEMMPETVAEMIGKEEYNPADKFIPANLYYQRATSLNADGTLDVRFVATIDKLDYAEVGFNITVTRTANGTSETSAKVPFVTTTVYESIYALGETVTAEELEGAYIVAIVITGIDCENYAHSIAVEAFVKDTAQSDATITASGTVTLAQTVAA